MEDWDEEDQQLVIQCETAQLCASAVALAAAIDVCRDKQSRTQLLLALKSVVWRLNPPRGEIHEFNKKAN